MEMHQVRYFLAVARHLNFTRAAAELHVAQPSLTRAIQKFEAELDGPLFRRERKHTHLTELGRMMLPHLQASLSAAEAAKTQARRLRMQKVGSLTLGISSDANVAAAQELVMATVHRLDNLSLSVDVASTAVVERQLLAGEFDAAILGPVASPPDRFDCRVLSDDAVVVAFGNDHRFTGKQSVSLASLDGEPLVLWGGRGGDDDTGRLVDGFATSGHASHRTNDARWIALLVSQGLGCAILPESLARAYALTYRELEGSTLRHPTVLATVAGRRHSQALSTLLHALASVAA